MQSISKEDIHVTCGYVMRVGRRWNSRHLFNVLARYLVPFRLAREGYFFWRKAYSSRMASATSFLLLMSSWLLGEGKPRAFS